MLNTHYSNSFFIKNCFIITINNIIAPKVIYISAILNTGKLNKFMFTKSITCPLKILSIRFPNPPVRTNISDINSIMPILFMFSFKNLMIIPSITMFTKIINITLFSFKPNAIPVFSVYVKFKNPGINTKLLLIATNFMI